MSNKVCKQFNHNLKKGEIIFRYPRLKDLDDLLEHINLLVKEKAMIDIQEKQNRKKEKEWLSYLLREVKNKEKVCLVVEIKRKIMGLAEIEKLKISDRRHIGELGITLKKEIRGQGIGKKLLEKVIRKAKKVLKIKIIILHVMDINKIACDVYRKVGFVEVGRIKKGRKYYNRYVDDIIMVKYL